MSSYKGCRVPEDLLYNLEYHVWVKREGEIVTVGATEPAQAYAGEIIYIKVKGKGTRIEKGAIMATIESAKYMGPMRAPLTGTIEEVNSEVLSKPSLINQDAYLNWVAKVRAESLDEQLKLLMPGNEAAEKYKPIIEEWGVECGKK